MQLEEEDRIEEYLLLLRFFSSLSNVMNLHLMISVTAKKLVKTFKWCPLIYSP